jgi:hypothetical protein
MKDVLKQVIGGIILIVVAPIVTYILGWWPFIIKVSKGFIIWLSQAALVYNWLYILLLLLASYSLFGSKGLLLFLKRRKVVARYSCLEEVFVLFILTKVDGQSLCLEDIANGIRCNNIRTLHALDKLQEKGFVVKSSHGGGDLYGLSSRGREEIVKLNIDEALKNQER